MAWLHRKRWLLVPILALSMLLAAPPASRAQTGPPPRWTAWALSVDFSGGAMKVLYKAYIATYDSPPLIAASYNEDITASCVTNTGAPIQFSGDYAVFDGSYYITCTVPSWRDSVRKIDPKLWPIGGATITATTGDGPVWAAADLVLSQVTANNPVLDARDLGVVFSVPRTGSTAQSTIALSNGALASPSWGADNLAGNQLLLGTYGAAIQSFQDTYGWLGFLHDPTWRSYFSGQATGIRYACWVEQPTRKATRSAAFGSYTLATGGGTVSIGYSPSTGSYFYGKIRSIRFDPGSKGI